MAVDNVIARIAGVVTYSDGSVEQISAHVDELDNLSTNSASESQEAVTQVYTDTTWFQGMHTLLGTSAVATVGTPVSDKTVTDMTAEFSGRVSYDDQTWGDFIVQYVNGAFVPDGGSVTYWQDALANSVTLAKMTELFEVVHGEGNIVLGP